MSASMFKTSALRSTLRSTPATSSLSGATRRQAFASKAKPSSRTHSSSHSSSGSSSRSSWSDKAKEQAKREQERHDRALHVGGWTALLALSCMLETPLFADSSSDTPPPQRRQRYYERSKANKGGVLYIPRAVTEEEEEVEVEGEEEAEPSLEAGSVETIAAVVAEDPGQGESEQQGAYDPETGAINWDCPCLGGMAHGPCGEQFKEAFSCFIYSEQEPKGIECVDKFKIMQDCFRAHPDVYQEELEMDEQDELNALVTETETALGIERLAL